MIRFPSHFLFKTVKTWMRLRTVVSFGPPTLLKRFRVQTRPDLFHYLKVQYQISNSGHLLVTLAKYRFDAIFQLYLPRGNFEAQRILKLFQGSKPILFPYRHHLKFVHFQTEQKSILNHQIAG